MDNSEDKYQEESAEIKENFSAGIAVQDDGEEAGGFASAQDEDVLSAQDDEGLVEDDFPDIRILDSAADNTVTGLPGGQDVQLSDGIRKKLPGDFDISSIGAIDLSEAEKIAGEEIVFLTEADLIEGLEEFELIPLKKFESDETLTEQKPEEELPRIRIQVAESGPDTEKGEEDDVLFRSFEPGEEDIVFFDEPAEVNKEKFSPEEDRAPAREIISEEGSAEVHVAEEIRLDEETGASFEEKPEEKETFRLEEIELPQPESGEEIFYFDDEKDEFIVKEPDVPVIDEEHYALLTDSEAEDEIEDEVPEEGEDREPNKENSSIYINDEALNRQLSGVLAVERITEPETLPAKFSGIEKHKGISFIDDEYVSSTADTSTGVQEDPLTDRLVEMIDVAEGNLILLDETMSRRAHPEYILENMGAVVQSADLPSERDELFFGDSEIDFVENAVMRDDYGRYIQEIDEYYEPELVSSDSEIAEILGLVGQESEFFEDRMFGEYYSGIDIESEIEFITTDLDFFDRGYVGEKEFDYLMNKPGSLLDEEKKSIEEDVTSEKAIIFEEDVDELIELLGDEYYSEKGSEPEIFAPEPANIVEETEEEEFVESEMPENITDRIIILEDEKNIEKFTAKFPEKKEDLIKLLSYLDGLFEKLPEETVKKFAESEYFDLYSRVLKEMGV